ncbi:DUF1801 domain-containing protein [Fodinicola feengrottensis]|uniref:Uncharacterized protein n=1 Tax=Fodinicola feengrottensis TaxID=435914 RepID=A0ABN2HEP4_9ACTN|nr:DUF1801 domain-containing protein [Fodinicola feengrottensis]
MFKVAVGTVEDYLGFDPDREKDLRATDALIRAAAPDLGRHFVAGTASGRPGMSMTMIGYGQFHYTVKASPEPIDWPIVGLALQKNYLSLYLAPREDGTFSSPRTPANWVAYAWVTQACATSPSQIWPPTNSPTCSPLSTPPPRPGRSSATAAPNSEVPHFPPQRASF